MDNVCPKCGVSSVVHGANYCKDCLNWLERQQSSNAPPKLTGSKLPRSSFQGIPRIQPGKSIKKKSTLRKICECGKMMADDDAEFWGECRECRGLPTDSQTIGKDTGADKADREYHGGLGNRGEW